MIKNGVFTSETPIFGVKRIIEAKKVLIPNKQKLSVEKSLSPMKKKTKHLTRLCSQGKSNIRSVFKKWLKYTKKQTLLLFIENYKEK